MFPTTAADWHRRLVPPPAPLPRRAAALWLVGLTVLAAVLRFVRLDQPCLWGDEALVYWRTCGTYAELLVPLHTDGFPPLHYEAVWVVGHGFDARLWLPWTVPAAIAVAAAVGLCVTLLRRGWLVADRVTPRPERLPLVVPAVAAAAWLWFAPGHYRLLYLGHVHWAGVPLSPRVLRLLPAVNGTLLVPAVYAVAVQLVPRRPALLAAALAAGSGFMLIYSRDAKMYMNCWTPAATGVAALLWWLRTGRATAWLCWVATATTAVGFHASGLIPVGLSLVFLLTHRALRLRQAALWLAGVVVIVAGVVGYYTQFNRWVDRVETDGWQDSGLTWINWYNLGRTGPDLARFAGTTFLTGWEWPKKDAANDLVIVHPARVIWPERVTVWLAVALAAGLLPWPRRWQGWGRAEPDRDGPAEPPWRVGVWLGLWVAVPTYAFYCRSGGNFASPIDWAKAAWSWSALDARHSCDWTALGLVRAGRLFALAGLFVAAVHRPPARLPTVTVAVLAFVMVLIVASDQPASGWAVLLLFAASLRVWLGTGRRFDAWVAAAVFGWVWTVTDVRVALVAAATLRVCFDRRTFDRGLIAAAVVTTVWAACEVVYLAAVPLARDGAAAGKAWQSVWVPRYMGVVWPGIAIAVATLVTRLPTRPVRWVVVTLLLGFNLYVGGLRVFGRTEPPVDRMAADAFAAQGSAMTVAWFDLGDGSGFPGSGTLFSEPGLYYLQQLGRFPMSPARFKASRANYKFDRGQVEGGGLTRRVAGLPNASRVVVWEQVGAGVPRVPRPGRREPAGWTGQPESADAVAARLPGRWRLASENWYTVRDLWAWRDVGRYCRREFVRAGGG